MTAPRAMQHTHGADHVDIGVDRHTESGGKQVRDPLKPMMEGIEVERAIRHGLPLCLARGYARLCTVSSSELRSPTVAPSWIVLMQIGAINGRRLHRDNAADRGL